MDRIIPILILIGLAVLGFIVKFVEIYDFDKRLTFTKEYRDKFITLCNDIFSNNHFDQAIYYELTAAVKDMQAELGADGIYAYVQDNLKGVATRNYQALVNFFPELRTAINEKQNSIMAMRLSRSITDCDDMFLRHIGTLTSQIDATRKAAKNPFSCFAEGVRTIISLPILLLKWFGIISSTTSKKLKSNWIVKIISILVTLVGFVGSVITIIIGWNQFVEIMSKIL